MSVIFGNGTTIIQVDWATLVEYKSSKNLLFQYDDNGIVYNIFAFDASLIYQTIIYKGIIPSVSGEDQATNDANKADFETNYKPISNRPITIENRVTTLNYNNIEVSGTQYSLIIDLSNPGGVYKHIGTSGIKIAAYQATVIKTDIPDRWKIESGIILSTTGSNVTIGWLELGALSFDDSQLIRDVSFYPGNYYVDATVSGGAFVKTLNVYQETTTDLTNASQLYDFSQTLRTIEVGDYISRIRQQSGIGTLSLTSVLWYYVE